MNKFFVTILAALLLAGCQTQQTKTVAYPQIQFAPGTPSNFKIQNIADGRTPGDLLRVSIIGQSSSSSLNTLYYRFTWLDQNGFEVQSLTSRWEKLVIPGRDPVTINRIATSPKAVDYRVFFSDKRSVEKSQNKGISE